MITRMTSLAALVAAGMTLAACQEEEAEVTIEEEVTTEEAGNEVDMEAGEAEVVETEAETDVVEVEDEPAESELVETETDTVLVEEGGIATEDATGEPAAEVELEENATAPTDLPEAEAEVAAEVEATAAEVESAAGGSDQTIEELLTTENFQSDEVVTYLETADIDDNTREALTQAVEQVDTSNETELNALISRLQIALGLEAEPAAVTE